MKKIIISIVLVICLFLISGCNKSNSNLQLYYAIKNENIEEVRSLLNEYPKIINERASSGTGIYVDKPNIYPLWAACSIGNPQIVKILIEEYNANVNITDDSSSLKVNALQWALESNNEYKYEIANYLIEKGVDDLCGTSDELKTIQYAISINLDYPKHDIESLNFVKLLYEHEAIITEELLVYAAKYYNIEVVKWIVFTEKIDNIEFACSKTLLSMLEIYDYRLNQNEITKAKADRFIAIGTFLLDNNANPYYIGDNNKCAYDYAVESNFIEMIDLINNKKSS